MSSVATTAAIMLRTGLPGAGKTLFTLDEVHRLSEAEPNLTVYYSGIAGLKVPGWVELEDPTKWFELPSNSVVVIDEAQRIFRPRHTSSSVPDYVARLETIRHQGIRLYVITQHPKLVESNVRRLCGDHVHYVRAFGSKVVVRHRWAQVVDDPDKTRSESIKETVQHPTHVYNWYNSAEIHTVKKRVPLRVWAVCVIPFLVIGCGYGAYRFLVRNSDGTRIAKDVAPSTSGTSSTTKPAAPSSLTPREYVAAWVPRVPGLAYSAPVFDGLTSPKAAPFPAGCVESAKSCHCYTEQGTRLEVEPSFCANVVERGFFQFWRDPNQQQAHASPGQRREDAAPAAAAPTPAPRPATSSPGNGSTANSVSDGPRDSRPIWPAWRS